MQWNKKEIKKLLDLTVNFTAHLSIYSALLCDEKQCSVHLFFTARGLLKLLIAGGND